MDLANGLAAVSSAIGIAKTLRKVEQDLDVAAYKSQVADLMNALTDAKLALTEARDFIAAKDAEIARLSAAFEDQASLRVGANGYKYKLNENGEMDGYPVCPRCEPVDNRIVQLVPDGHWRNGKCPACQSVFSPVDPINSVAERQHREQGEHATAMIRSAGRRMYADY